MRDFSEFYFNSSTGVNTIRAIKCYPDTKPKAIIQIAHGVADHIDRYKDFMSFLADNGFMVVGNDHLGHGHSIRHPIEQGFFAYENGWQHVVNDMDTLRSIAAVEFPELPYIFFGHSMGSFLTRTYIIQHPNNYHAAVISGTGHMNSATVNSGYLLASSIAKAKGPRYISKLIDSIAFGAYNKAFEPARTRYDWISRDTQEVDKYIADPYCGFIATASLFAEMMKGIKFITDEKNISGMNKNKAILFLSGDMDPVGEYGEGVKRAYNAFCKAGLKDVYMKLYAGGRHEMLNELNRKEVYNDVLNWINSKL